MKTQFLKSAILTTLLLVTTLAFSANSFDYEVANVAVLQMREVQIDMGVTEAQRKKLNEHADWFNAETGKLQKAYQEAIQKGEKPADPTAKMEKLSADFKKKVLAVLTAGQLKRLRELTLRAAGTLALLDETVAKRIGLTDKQMTKLRTKAQENEQKGTKIKIDALKPIQDKYQGKNPKTEDEAKKLSQEMEAEIKAAEAKIAPKLQKLQEEWAAFVRKTVNAKQKNNFDALLGKPLKK